VKLTTSSSRELNLIRALLHGDSGVGKTTSIMTLPPKKTVVAGSERSLLPLRHNEYAVAVVETWDDVRELHRKMLDPAGFLEEFKAAGSQGECEEIGVLAIDSLTEYSEMCKRWIVEVERKQLLADRKELKGKEQVLGIYDDLMTQEDWNLYTTRMKNVVSAYCHLPVHVIFTSLSAFSENKKTNEVIKTPAINGKFAFEIPGQFDAVFHMESQDVPGSDGTQNRRVWRTYNDGTVLAKGIRDANGKDLPPFIEPDWGKFFSRILAKKESK
jgi:GTPase SAR1 family protein